MSSYQPSNPRPRLPSETDVDDGHHAPVFFRKLTEHDFPVLRSPKTKCYFTILGWAMTIKRLDGQSRVEEGPNYRQREWSGSLETLCFRWQTLPRKSSQIQDILDLPVTCHNTCTVTEQRDEYHLRGLDAMKHTLQHYRSRPGRYFALWCLHRLQDLSEHTNPQALRLLAQRTSWPWSMDQLLPHGAEATARSFLMWTTLDLDDNFILRIALALTTWIQYTYLDIKPYIYTSPTAAQGLAHLAAKLSEACFHPPPDYKAVQDTRNELQNTYLAVLGIAEIYGMILAPAPRVHAQRFIGFCPKNLLASCDIAIQCLQHLSVVDQDLELQKRLTQSCDRLGSISWKAREACLAAGESYQISFVAIRQIEQSPFHKLCRFDGGQSAVQDWLFLVERCSSRSASRHCDYSGCSQQGQFEDEPMRVCGQCRILRYCSRLCQKRAWTHMAAPHRDICRDLRFVGVSFEINSRSFAKLVGKTVPPKLLKLAAIQSALKHIVKSLSALDMDEMHRPCELLSIIISFDVPETSH
jgi:hypothetical protein